MKNLMFMLILIGCSKQPKIDPLATKWNRFHDPDLAISFDYPQVYTIAQKNSQTRFVYDGPTMLIRFVDEAEGRERGLWFGHDPAETVLIGGRPATKYLYDHGDGPFLSKTIAYVWPHQGKYLGLEFRTDEPDLQKRILQSVIFN